MARQMAIGTDSAGRLASIGPETDAPVAAAMPEGWLRAAGWNAAAPHASVERIGPVRVLWPAGGWEGVRLRLRSARDETDRRFEIGLSAGDGRTVVVAVLDDEDAVAAWRGVAAASGLPMLIERPDGTLSAPCPQIGRLALGPLRHRRRHAFLKGRRPRFLQRRRTGDGARLVPVSGVPMA